MKKIIIFLFPVYFLVACSARAAVPAQPAEVIQFTPVVPAFTPIPTLTAEVVIQPTSDFPTFIAPAQANAILFAPNGTSADIADAIPFGSSKTYSINAMQGQIMSISILPQIPGGDWGYIPMQISGADGSILCPQAVDSECMFWRGTLPSSQDYFLTLTPNGNISQFVMRIAINPPGKDVQYFHYGNLITGLSLTYPDTFAPALPIVGNYKMGPDLVLHYIDPNAYDKTNLSEVYLFVSSSVDAQMAATCTEPNQNGGGGPEYIIGDEVVNGYTFVHSTSEGAGAGNYFQQEIYRMVNNNKCYEVIYSIHSTNIGNYTPGTVTEFDRNDITKKLYDIFSTIAIQ